MFKKVLLITIAVVALIAVGLTVYVSNMDWNAYKEDVAARFSKTMGKKIEFSGNLSVSLWPKPHLSAKNVNILNPETSEKIATVKKMEAQLSLRALLEGTPEIATLSLNNTEIWYVVDENGVSNWRQQQKGGLLDSNIEFNRQTINVQNSWLHYQNRKYEIEAEFSQINADIVAESLVGPYRVDGNFVYAEDNYGFAVGLGDISQTDDIFLNFAITHPRSNSYILYDGTYNMSSGAFKGNFSGEFQLLATLVNSFTREQTLADMFNVPFVFSVVLDANSQMLTLNSLALKYAEVIEGSGNIKIPLTASEGQKPVVEVDYQLLNLDAQPLVMIAHMALDALHNGQLLYEPQTSFDVLMNLSAQRMIISEAADGALENVSFKGSWQNNELNIDEFYAACPGNIVWTMSGSLLAEEKMPNLFLKTRIEGKNFGALVRAFDYPLATPSQSAYRNIDLSFNLSANPHTLLLTDLQATLDKSHAEGILKADFGQQRAKYELSAEVDTVNLDNYLAAPEDGSDLSTIIKQYLNLLAGLQTADITADMAIEQLTFRGIPTQGIVLNLSSAEDLLNINKLAIEDVLGTKISLDVVLKNLGSSEPNFAPLNYSFTSANIEPIIVKLGLPLPQWHLFKEQPMQATGTLQGSLSEAEINTSTTLKDILFSYKGSLAQEEFFTFNGHGVLKSTNFNKVINNLGGHWEKFKNTSALNCSADLQGNTQNWQMSSLQCILGTAKYIGDLSLQQKPDLSIISGKIKTTEFDLTNVLDIQSTKTSYESNILHADDFMAHPSFNRDLYRFDAYRKIAADVDLMADAVLFNGASMQNVSTHFKNDTNRIYLDNLKFTYLQAFYSGNLQIDYTQQPKIKGQLQGENIKLNHIGGKIYKLNSESGQAQIDFISSAVSMEDFMKNLNGSANFTVTGLKVDGWDFAAIEQDLQKRVYSKGVFQTVRDNLQRGQTDFTSCQGKILWQNGVWNFENTTCQNDIMTLNMTGQDDIDAWQMNNRFTAQFTTLAELPPIEFTFSGLLNKPTLDVNVEAAAKQYDDHWAEIAKQEQDLQDKQRRQLNAQMTQAQQNVTDLAGRLGQMTAQLENKIEATGEKEYIDWYQQKNEHLQFIGQQLDEMQALARQTDFTKEDIGKINERCREYGEYLDTLETELEIKYNDDLKAQAQTLQENVRTLKNTNSRLYADYQTQWQEKSSQIIRFDVSQNPAEDADLQKQRQKMEEKRDAFWDVSYQISDAFLSFYNLTATEDLQKALTGLKEQAAKLTDANEQMAAISQQILEALDTKIQEQKAAQEEQLARQREIEKKEREANKDNLLVNKKENKAEQQSPAVEQTEISSETKEPINEAESHEKKSTLRAIDDSVVLGKVSGKITPAYAPLQPATNQNIPTSGLLRAVEGKIEGASGSINVK